jgi:hypothetical protein
MAASRTAASGGEAIFRSLALAFPGAFESSHMGSADFRVNDRIFATLAYVAKGLGTLKLKPEQQAEFLADAPEYFTPAPGGWGRMGMTLVKLDAPEAVISGALATAYRNVEAALGPKKASPRKPRLQ